MKNFILAGLRCRTQEGKGSEEKRELTLIFRGSAFALVLFGTAMTQTHVMAILVPRIFWRSNVECACTFSHAMEE